MPPQLTESWAGTYLQVLATLLVFALGIPALLLQVIVPEDLRRLIHRRLRRLRWSVSVISFLIVIVAAGLIWVLHPCPNSYIPGWQHLAAAVAMTAILVVTIVFWLISSRICRRDTVIRDLERDSTKMACRSGMLAERPLADLIYLGEQGDAGLEKTQALEALDRLAAQVQSVNAYAGDGLEQLVQGIEAILMGGGQRGSVGNFRLAAGIQGRIMVRLQELGLTASPDMSITLRTLGRLGVAALHLESEPIAVAFLETVASSDDGQDGAFQAASQRLFEIGTSALETKRFLIAVAALNKLEALAERRLPLTGEISADLLGLLAHFWTAGKAARGHARSVLSRTEASFSPSLRDCLRSAIKHQIRTTEFDTADKLEIMLAKLEERNASGD